MLDVTCKVKQLAAKLMYTYYRYSNQYNIMAKCI